MEKSKVSTCLLLVLGFASFWKSGAATDGYKVVCYLGSWANYRNGDGKFMIEDIDPFLCTHVIYGFAKLDAGSNRIAAYDPYLDLKENWGLGAFERFNALKHRNPELKTLLAIGGWNEGSTKYSQMAASTGARRVFVDSCVEMLARYGFDGLDLDWEYPANRGGVPEDKRNFALLLKELREAFEPRNLLISAAVSAGQQTIDSAYDVPALGKYLHFINLMTYDFHGAWDSTTGHNAPLFPRPETSDADKKLTVDYAVKYWLKKGAPVQKLVLGMALYGRSFALSNSVSHRSGSPVTGPGIAGRYTGEPGMIGFHEICELLQGDSSWTVIFDSVHKVPYMYKDKQWITYDNVESISFKVDYIKKMNLAGGMVWSIETDDFRGRCEGYPYPLLSTIRNGLNGKPPKPQTTTEKAVPSSSTVRPSTPAHMPSTIKIHKSSEVPEDTSRSSTHNPISESSTAVPDVSMACVHPGYFRDPTNCKKFYLCVSNSLYNSAKYSRFSYTCAPGTVFSERMQACSFARDVPECASDSDY